MWILVKEFDICKNHIPKKFRFKMAHFYKNSLADNLNMDQNFMGVTLKQVSQ